MSTLNVYVLTDGDLDIIGIYATKQDAVTEFVRHVQSNEQWHRRILENLKNFQEEDGELIKAIQNLPYNIDEINLDVHGEYTFTQHQVKLPIKETKKKRRVK